MDQIINKIKKILKLEVVIMLSFSCGGPQLFESVPASKSGLDFSNDIVETLDFNIEKDLFMYNGGGVAIGDLTNDGLPDIYFSANQKPDKLYINLGGMKFKDGTNEAGIGDDNNSWTTGVTMADINSDGWLDIYVCQLYGIDGLKGTNKLFVNNTNGTFTERSEEFGLNARTYSQHAAFFDYDLDGDLDMYLLNLGVSSSLLNQGTIQDSLAADRLFENRNGFYVDVSKEAGIHEGSTDFGLSLGIGDLNNDDYPDIFIANDFSSQDYLYMNNGDGTFRENGAKSMGHTSFSSHGCDITDTNNDGFLDIFTLDRKSNDEEIAKTSLSSDEYGNYSLIMDHGYYYQFQRNMLQINRGNLSGSSLVSFSELGEFAGVSATDWSWASLFADFDLDGDKDLFVSNGIPHRPMDLDFLRFKTSKVQDSLNLDQLALITMMPKGETTNVAFENANRKFKNVSKAWGLDLNGCSNGAGYADLDNDGDLDIVINNLNAIASIYENKASEQLNRNFIKLNLDGKQFNPLGIGTRVTIYSSGIMQTQELYTTRGWLSSVDHALIFGLGNAEFIDSLIVNWKDGKIQCLKNIKPNQTLTIRYADAEELKPEFSSSGERQFIEIDVKQSGIDYHHEENDFVDFDYEKLIPKMLSHEGPKIAIGDVNGDGWADFYIGGAKNQSGKIYVQTSLGDKIFKEVENEIFFRDRVYEDAGSVFIDVDLDLDLDLYIVSGGSEPFKDFTLTDRLYLNDGQGHFSKSLQHPQLAFNGSCAVVGDLNQDGVNDIFVGGRSIPGSYGKYPRSRILLGDGEGHLFDATARAFGDKINLGMVTDAVWLEESKELVVIGDWLPITILSFRDEKILEKKLTNTAGWWNTIHAVDIDGDGDKDILVGNYGLNSNLKCSSEYPVNLYVKDFDNNGSIDPVLAYFRNTVEYPYYGLDKMEKQLPAIKKAYATYKSYASSTFPEIFPLEELTGSGRWQVKQFASVYLENNGDGNFSLSPLPEDLQMAPIFGFDSDDIDGDGNIDVLAVGNFYGNQPDIGKLDASYGHYLSKTNDSWGTVEPRRSGFAVKGEARDIRILDSINEGKIILVSRNNTEIQVFKVK